MKKATLIILFLAIHFVKIYSQAYYNVKQYGATGIKTDNATQFIQKAIDECSMHGGGTIYFPAGEYLCSSIYLRDNIRLFLDAGAVIWASKNELDYKSGKEMDETIAGTKATTLITAFDCKNISITGPGRIEGQPIHTFEPLKEIDSFIDKEQRHAQASGVDMRRAYVQSPRVCLVYLVGCEDVRLDNFSVMHSPSWSVHIQWCDRVFVNNMYIHSDSIWGVNADGLDIDGCKNVLVSNCNIFTFDDAICLKSTNTKGKFLSCENISISNCVVQSTSAALKIGTETWGDFRNIQFDNCVVHWSNRAMGIIIRDGGTVDNVRFSNIIINATRGRHENWGDAEAFRLVVLKRNANSKVGKIKNVRVENIMANVQGNSRLEGIEGSWLENITIRNLKMMVNPETAPDKRCSHALMVNKVKGLTLDDVQISWNEVSTEPLWMSAIFMDEAEHVSINNFKGRQGLVNANSPAMMIQRTNDLLIRNSIADENTGTFIQIDDISNTIRLQNNIFDKAKSYFIIPKQNKKRVIVD